MGETAVPNLDKYIQAVKAITKSQSRIVGENVALELARSTEGLRIDNKDNIMIEGDPVEVLRNLVDKYSILFGKISIDVSRDAVDHLHLFEDRELPANLR